MIVLPRGKVHEAKANKWRCYITRREIPFVKFPGGTESAGRKVAPVFNSRSMALEGDLKLGRTMGLLTPKIFYFGCRMKSDHPVISIQKSRAAGRASGPYNAAVNDNHYLGGWRLVNSHSISLSPLFLWLFLNVRPLIARPHFRIHLVRLMFIPVFIVRHNRQLLKYKLSKKDAHKTLTRLKYLEIVRIKKIKKVCVKINIHIFLI